ncbi:hypothetical protein Poli38472_013128 [Pythium oligandrum]|uniref:FAD-binding domain-containing protein n=1 Tax=Pythium oligandrum TaxID=41045 RepID=A0A8K1C2G6_PYTOL|nr:hypothetical protein Poli38472_013128 [Pythium oligandrum]|eukprot:TMW55237.1 hypothetical protein Poli38472_013128 [Pythium oligandrum]
MTPTQTQDNRRVLIIGGGIGGLCLAQGLKRQGIPSTVFERDPSVTSRSQGYRLRINNDGFDALEAYLSPKILDVFKASSAEFIPGFQFFDPKTGEPSATPPPSADDKRPSGPPPSGDVTRVFSADRVVLRSVLLLGLDSNELRYDMAFESYTILENGLVEAVFENGERVTGSLLVGADGTFSRTPLTPELEIALHPALHRGTSLITSREPHVSLFMEPMRFTKGNPQDISPELPDTKDYVYWVLISRSHNFHVAGYSSDEELLALNPAQAAELAQEMTKDWDARIRALFHCDHVGDSCGYVRVSTMPPDIGDWDAPCVTVMGDAIHAMTAAGVGANAALMDARVLLKSIQTYGVADEAVAAYEAEMRLYARKLVAMTAGAGKKMNDQPDFEDMKPYH